MGVVFCALSSAITSHLFLRSYVPYHMRIYPISVWDVPYAYSHNYRMPVRVLLLLLLLAAVTYNQVQPLRFNYLAS